VSELSNPNRPAPSAPRPYRFPDFTRHSLDNGLTVWFVPIAGSSLTSVHLLIDAGAAAEDEPHGGVASLTACSSPERVAWTPQRSPLRPSDSASR